MYILGGFLALTELTLYKQLVKLDQDVEKVLQYTLITLIFLCAVVGAIYEGIRFQQYFFILASMWMSVLILTDSQSIVGLTVFVIVLLVSVLNNVLFGEANFRLLKMVGPYQVGHQDIHTSQEGIAVSVYYPMDIDEYKILIKRRKRNTKWLRYGEEQILGITKATADIGSKTHPPTCIFNYMRKILMYTVQDGPVSVDFGGEREVGGGRGKY